MSMEKFEWQQQYQCVAKHVSENVFLTKKIDCFDFASDISDVFLN